VIVSHTVRSASASVHIRNTPLRPASVQSGVNYLSSFQLTLCRLCGQVGSVEPFSRRSRWPACYAYIYYNIIRLVGTVDIQKVRTGPWRDKKKKMICEQYIRSDIPIRLTETEVRGRSHSNIFNGRAKRNIM